MEQTTSGRVRFGLFELDPRAGELHHNGQSTVLQEQQLKVLLMLIERAGEIATRDAIRTKLWPDDIVVDFDHGINSTIKKLRTQLGDSADSPKYIETVARRGYRLMVPVEWNYYSDIATAESSLGEGNARADLDSAATPGPKLEVAVVFRNDLERSRSEPVSAEEIGPPRRRWRYVAAVAAVVAIVAGGLYYRVRRNTHKLTDKDTIVVADFENHTGDPVLGDAMNAGLTVELQQSPFLNLLAPDKVRTALKQMNRAESEKMTPEVALEVCRHTHSTALVTGSIADDGNQYKVSLKATDCQSGKQWTKAELESADRSHIVHALGEAGHQLRGGLGEPKGSLQHFNQPLEVATSAFPEALQAVALGAKTQAIKEGSGLAYAKRAVDLDPQFALANNLLGVMYGNNGEETRAIECFKRAFELRNRATQRDRLYIEAKYYGNVTDELDKTIGVWSQLAETYPRDPRYHNNLGMYLGAAGEYEKGLAEARESLRIDPDDYRPVSIIMIAEMSLERPEAAKAAYEQARSRGFDSSLLQWHRYRMAFLQKDVAAMQQQVAWALQSDRGIVLLFDQSNTERYYGRVARAREVARTASEAAERGDARDLAASWIVDEALADAEIGEPQKAGESVARAFALDKMDRSNVDGVLALARCGHLNEAERAVDELHKRSPLSSSLNDFAIPSIRAAIALGRHNPSEAIEQLKRTERYELGVSDLPPLYPAYLRGIAYLQLGEPSQAAAEFQKLIDHPGIVVNAVIGALAQLQIGRAQVMAGDKEAARQSYQDFLTLWKDADPDIPIYRQAKAEYAKLMKLPATTRERN